MRWVWLRTIRTIYIYIIYTVHVIFLRLTLRWDRLRIGSDNQAGEGRRGGVRKKRGKRRGILWGESVLTEERGVPGRRNPRREPPFWGLKAWIAPLFFFPWNIFTEIRGHTVTHFRKLCQYIGKGGVGVVGNYCLHGLCGRREAEREGTVGRGPSWGTDSEGLLRSIILVSFFSPSPSFPTFSSSLSRLDSVISLGCFLHPSSCAVHSSSRDSVLMSLGTPPVLDRARMVWLTAAISTAREMGSWCSLCAALSSWKQGGQKHSSGSERVQFQHHVDQLTVQLSNHSLATVTRHSRPVKLWISQHVETVWMGCCRKDTQHFKKVQRVVSFVSLSKT